MENFLLALFVVISAPISYLLFTFAIQIGRDHKIVIKTKK